MKEFSPRAKKILYAIAQDEGRLLGSAQLLPEHILLAILKLKEGFAYSVLLHLGLNILKLQTTLTDYFKQNSSSPNLNEIPESERYKNLIEVAEKEAAALHCDYIGTEHLLLALVREEKSLTEQFFASEGISVMDVRLTVVDLQAEGVSASEFSLSESVVDSLFKSIFSKEEGLFSVFDEKKKEKKESSNKSKMEEKLPILSEYSRDLTKLALENKNDSVVCREKEIRRIIQILSRRTKNNPVLVGEPGVGKTAIVEGLAQEIAQGNVPQNLLKKKILSLDLTSMVAGTKYRGDFEERMKKMMKEIQENKNIILFIDELHTIIGAGGTEGTMDASNIMKPALSRGEIQIIGATTTKEYTRHIEKDQALERRFQVVQVEEPSDSETEKILEGIKKRYENFHGVIYDDAVIPAIVKLSRRYIPERVLPDKAIDILDEAGACKKIQYDEKSAEFSEIETSISQLIEEKKLLVKNQNYEKAALVRDKVLDLKRKLNSCANKITDGKSEKKRVMVSDTEKIISEMTGIPLEQLSTSETQRIIHMEDELHNTVIGQEEAVHLISAALRRSRAGISSPKHPAGSFIFLGPTGVGKTQLAKALAKYMFGNEEALIRIDMSDFMEKHNASRLVGAPPGYIGYENGGILTEQVRRHPYSVVLFDEIEKAHADVFNILLQLLEEGELCDNLGHKVNFKNTVVIMTSNAGARQITSEGRLGFGGNDGVLPYEEIKSGALNELKKLLNPELLNRIDEVIVFNALSKKEITKILEIQLKDLQQRLAEKNLTIILKPKAKEYLIEKGYNPSMGARPMARLIRREIEDPLSLEILEKAGQDFDTVVIECPSNKKGLRVKLTKKEKEIKINVPVSVLALK